RAETSDAGLAPVNLLDDVPEPDQPDMPRQSPDDAGNPLEVTADVEDRLGQVPGGGRSPQQPVPNTFRVVNDAPHNHVHAGHVVQEVGHIVDRQGFPHTASSPGQPPFVELDVDLDLVL